MRGREEYFRSISPDTAPFVFGGSLNQTMPAAIGHTIFTWRLRDIAHNLLAKIQRVEDDSSML